MVILGIESSCDETSIAILKDGKEILSNKISSQIEIHKEYGGVVPEIASRQHIKNIAAILDEALEEAKIRVAIMRISIMKRWVNGSINGLGKVISD